MNDFEFFSQTQNDDEEKKRGATVPQGDDDDTAAQGTSDFDFFSSIEPQKKPKEEYGALDSQRDKLQAELGDDPDVQTRAGAAFVNMIPFASTLSKENRDIRLKGLEALRSKSKMKEIDEMRKRNEKPVVPHKRSQSFLQRMLEGGAMAAGARSGMPMMSMPDGEASPVFSGDTHARLKAHDAEVKKRMDGSAEDAYFARLRDFAIKEAELKEAEVDKLQKESKTVDEFADKLSVAATDALTRFATAKKNAAKRLEKADLPWYKEVASGTISNAGYTGQFIAASGLPYAGLGFLAAAGASQRYGALTTKEYDIDDDGRLVVLHNEDDGGAGTVAKSVAGGVAEVAVEQYLEKGLGMLYGGVKRIPGIGKIVGKAGDAIAGAVGKATGAIGAKLSKNKAGKWLVGAARGFDKYSEITGVQGMPTEMLEEHVQSFADDVLGFDTKSRDKKSFGDDAAKWWNEKFWNKKSNREIFLGLIGTMAVQGTYAGVKAHHDIAKWRQNPAGFLKTMIDEKTVDSLSDDEVAHLFKFVSSPRFTKENVERFLGHVKDRVELSNALLQIQEANAPFFDTDGGALDEAISSGAIKSQYVPPTRSVMDGARQLDWQPYTMKDGRRTMRLYDPNTGIAIDAIGGDRNNVVVTNRDGSRFDVGSMENAMNVADRLSISNQLLDAKRPIKDAYVRKRIQEVFPGGDFVIMKNAAELNKMFPDISKDRDYDPTNPAFTKDGKVYLVLDNMRNAYEVNRMILHEAAIHTGLNKKFTTDEKRDFLRNISDPDTVKLMRRIGAVRGKANIDDLSDADIEEAFAHVWDRRRANPLFTQKVSHALREMGRRVGLPIDYNTDDLEVMVDTLQREGRKGGGNVASVDFDTTSHADSVPYNEAQRDYSGDVADIGKPVEETDDMAAIRQMQRIDRIKQNHPRMWSYAMRVNGNDEDAAADFVAKALEEEGKRGVRGEAEHGMHALEVADKLENGEDLTPDDIDILDEHGFTGPILYSDYGYRKQKNGVWKLQTTPEKPTEKPVGTTKTAVPAKNRTEAAVEGAGAQGEGVSGADGGVQVAQASANERTVIEKMTDKAPVEELSVDEVANDDSRIPNFKEGANPETGEVEPLKGEPYDLVSNPIVVMEFKDGKKVVVTGRHRLALYKRSGHGKIPARVIRERDGWTVDDAKTIDAIGNIIDEKGSVKDYVKYFDSAKPSREQAEKGGFLARPKGRRAFGIYEGAGENLRSIIDWEGTGGEGLISVEQAGTIAEAAPKGTHPRNEAVQKILARKALEGVRGKKLGILARALAEEVRNRKGTPKTGGEQQLDLFTSEDDLALMAAEERRAGYRAKKANEYTRIAEVLRTALRKGGKLDLNKSYAKELGITDPKNKDQLAAARDRAVERANYWENAVRLDDADKAEMDAALGVAPKSDAKPNLTLESSTAEEIKAEEDAQRQRDAIKAGQAAPLKGGTGEIGQTQLDLGDTNGDLFNPVVRNESVKPKGDFAQQITDAIDVDAKDGLIKVVPDARFGEGAHVALYAQGSESEIKAAADSLRTAFPDAKIFTDGNSVVVVPASGTSQGAAKPNDETIDLSDSLGDLDAMWFNRDFEKNAIISGDELESGNARRENGGLGGSLGYPSGFMPNRDVVDVFRKVLKETGESAKGTSLYGGGISPETAQTLFARLNSDADTARIFRRVFPVAQALGIEYSLSQYNGYKPGVVVLGDYECGSIRLHTNSLLRTDPQTVASTILHETIHGVTVYAMEVASGDIKNPKTKLTPELAEAAREIFDIYNANKKWMSEGYGATDAYEMIAELANPKFRDELKKKSVWHKLWDAIKRIFGAKVSNAHDDALNALDKFVENYSKAVFDSYVKDSYRNGLDGELLGINTHFSIRKEAPPKKIGVGYKVFVRGKDGKLYPPKVNPTGEATPEGVWLNADEGVRAGKSKTGRDKVKAGGEGTNGGGGTLAYRPGWHLGEIPYALQFNVGPKVPNPLGIKNKKGEVIKVGKFFPSNFVWGEVEYAADVDYQDEAMSYGRTENGAFNHALAGLPRIPENGSYVYRTNANPATDPWIITGAMRVNRILSNDEVDEIVRKAGREPQERDPQVRWFARGVDEHTEEERQAHNMVLGVKIIKNFAAKGGKDFGQFARSVKAIAPEVYGRIRNQMPGMWLNAWIGGEKALAVPQADEYEKILAATDAWNAPARSGAAPSASTEAAQKPHEREEAAGQDKDTPNHKTRGEAISAAADEMIDLIRVDATQRKLTRKDLENVVAKHLGGSVAEGTFEMKDVTDIMELAVNRILSGDIFAPTDKPIQKIALIRNVLNKIPTQTTRSAEQDKMQQFSTVPHEAFAAAWVANITDKDVMLEPSAGIGGIAVFAKNAGAEVILNELSPRRREILEQLGLAPKVYGFNAEHLWAQFYIPVKNGEVKRPTVVVMNPPFSNSALTSKKDTVGVGGKHIEEALEMLAPGGRLVAIVGHGMTHNADSPKVKAWWKKIGAKYRVRADVTVNGDEYAKYGTTYDNDILVIDKVAPDATIAPIFGKIQSIDELPAMLEGVRNDRPAIQSENVAPKPDNGGPVKGTPGRGNGGNHLQPGNGGNGGNKPHGKPAGRTDGRVPGAKEDGGRGHSSGTGLGVGSTVPDGAGLTEVRTAQGGNGEVAPRELGDGTFSAYRPAKVRIEGAKPHPTALVESTAMASVLPPDPTYSPILPKKAIESGMPSDAQLEQIVYAGQAHEQKLPDGRRKGYFFGDGTGLGKGTEIGGVISDNWNHGRRKAVWVSKKPQLINDAMRDLVTYGLDGQIFDFNPKKKSVMGRDMGIAFLSYDGLKQDCVFDTDGKVRSAKQGQRNRFQQLVEWLGKDFDGVIVFDEAHKAGNAVPTRGSRGAKPASKQALAVVALQDVLPNARILYVSATGATEVSNLSYATRLGLWGKGTAFRDRSDFINRVSAGGLSVMEIVARDMKSMGVYMARSLSYDGIVNRKLEHSLSPDQKRKYDEMADAWQMVMSRVGDALVTTGGVGNGNAVSAVMSALWGGQQRFFNQLLTAMQMPSVIADAKKQLDEGNSVVFQLINTNEATQKRAIEAQRQQNGEVNADELDLSPRDILVGFVRNSFPVVKYVEQEDDEGNKEWVVLTGPDGQPVEDPIALEARQELLDKLNMMKLDDNPLELIIEEFGADNVAEITGRSQRRQMVRNDDGEMEMKLVRRSDKICFTEASEFNDGKRRVLVFSDSGGTGFSFHADKRFGNQQKRIHYLVQAGWRADAALQGFGRTHRSNEAQPPEYVLCSTDIRGHQRFISTVARRLAQLGSLTAGDRASAGSGVFSDEDNLENQYAENAVKDLFHSIHREDFGRFNTICKQLGFVKMKLDKRTGDVNEVNDLIDPEDGTINDEKLSIQKFLNRILNCRVDVQNRLFDEFAEIMHDHIEQAKENGTFDPGLERLQGHKIEETSRTELWSGGKGTGSTDIVEIGVSNRTRKVDYETVLARMQRQAEGRNWFFARNTNSGKLFGFAETPRAKTLPSGLVVNQLRCYTPDGKAPLVLETDVRFDGDHANFEMVSEKDAATEWANALAAIPDMNTTKRYFVSGTLLPIWDRLAVQNPRIFRVAPTGGQSSFLGMEVKAENVNDVLRRFGKAAQSVELTPEAVLNRIVQDGRKVPLVQTGWELKRARVNGDYRIELVGPEDKKTLEKLAQNGLGTYERIGYVPRFFVPRTAEGLSRFLSEYPAMPEDGGISTVAGSGADYSALDYEQRQSKFTELFNGYQNALSGNGGHAEIVKAHDALDGLIAAMPTEELMNIVEEWQQYDTRRSADPVHIMRKMVRVELQKRGAIDDKQITELGLWFNRDIDALTDPLSSVAIHEVNAWRKARGLPEMPKSKRTPVEKIVKAGKYMASNADEMRRFIEVSARTPQNWTAVEVNAVAQRRIALEQDYDDKTRLINVAEMNGNKEEAQRIREARDLVQDQIDLMDSAINKAKREWGLAGLARRFMLNRDGTFARFSGEMRSIVGRELTDEEKQGAWTLWNAYRDAQGKLDEATVTKTAELLKDIVAKHMAEEEKRHRQGTGKSLAEIEREYLYALDHIRVHANRAGGVLVGLPNGRKWLDAIRRYHMARAIETGRKLTVDEMLSAIHEDIDGMVVADDHDIMQMTTGHGNTYEADDSELEKALREQRRLMNEYQKWEDMMEEGHLPDKTGLIRDEPTQAEREAQRTTREMMREFMQQHPELMQMDASRRLKTIQDSLMKRWQNEIDDLQRAIEDGERIMRQKNTMTYTPEMEAKRRELEQKRQEYREAFPPEPLTHEQKVARIMRVLQVRLAKLEEKRDALANASTDAERAAILAKPKNDKVDDSRLDALRDQIDEMKEDIEDLKTMHFPEGTPEEFTAMVARRRKALDKNIQRIQILLANRDFAPQRRDPSALAKRVAADPEIQALVKTRNAATKRLMEERERFRRSVLPYNAGRVLDWFNVLMSAPRVMRTMLDLSATMTQGAALFTSHPVMGYRALVDSVKAFASEANTDDIMAAMEADPDFAEFQLMGGHVYTVSDISERGVPEEFRGIATKLVKVNGKEYGLDDIPGVKASERSFGVFLNSINLSVYKAIKASGGWGPTGPTDTQKKDIALSLNVASGRGYENKGARGIWERIASAALWAPRFAISGAKMAIGWNIVAPHFTGLTTERSYKDRWVSSKVAAQQYVRQMASMAAWTLLGTLLMGRKDPEWLEEVLDPRSSNFLNVRIGNTNVNFFGPIKQWWTFMARILTRQTRGADGMVRNRSQMQTATTFVRGKLSPLAGLGVDLLNQKDFLGNKIVWGKEAGRKEVSGWKHVAESLALPLSSSDLIDAFKENSLANALMLTPFIVAGAGKSTYALDEYARVVSPYKAALKEYKAAMKEGRWADSKQILADNPALKRSASIDNLLKNVAMTKKYIENLEKAGKKPSEDILSRYERQQQAVMEAIRK